MVVAHQRSNMSTAQPMLRLYLHPLTSNPTIWWLLWKIPESSVEVLQPVNSNILRSIDGDDNEWGIGTQWGRNIHSNEWTIDLGVEESMMTRKVGQGDQYNHRWYGQAS